jgi:hypothetical protein
LATLKENLPLSLLVRKYQANSGNWQQTLSIHPNNNRGTETQQSTNDFDTNGNLLNLNNIGSLKWCYNNSLNQLTKADKPNTTLLKICVVGSGVFWFSCFLNLV